MPGLTEKGLGNKLSGGHRASRAILHWTHLTLKDLGGSTTNPPASLRQDQPVQGYRGLGAGRQEVEARLAPLLATALLSSWRECRGSGLAQPWRLPHSPQTRETGSTQGVMRLRSGPRSASDRFCKPLSRSGPQWPRLLNKNVMLKCACVRAQSLQACLTLCNPMDCSPPGSSVYGILQARMLE